MAALDDALNSLFHTNMGTRNEERIIVFGDTIRPDEVLSPDDRTRRERLLEVAAAAARYAKDTFGNAGLVTFPATAASGAEPPEVLWRATFGDGIVDTLAGGGILGRLLTKQATPEDLETARRIVRDGRTGVADVVIGLANNSTSHTRYRALVNEAGGRFASLPHFDPEMFFTSMCVDWQALAERTRLLAEEVNRATRIRVETPNGTSMVFGKSGRTAAGDDGLLHTPGSFGNLPAGEVYLAPLEGTSAGTMVIEYAPTHRLTFPLVLLVQDGNVVDIAGQDPYREVLLQKFAESPKNRNIAELGIGTNDRATRPDNVLEAEKILGTIHIALGDNSGFGGTVNTPFHEDFVFYHPTLTAILPDGTEKTILRDGILLIE